MRRLITVGAALSACTSTFGQLSGLGFLPGATATEVGRISADGVSVLGASGTPPSLPPAPSGGFSPTVWTRSSGLRALGDPILGGAIDLDGDGDVFVGVTAVSQGVRGFWFGQGEGVIIEPLPGASDSAALAVSSDGGTAVGRSDLIPIRWTQGAGTQSLGGLPGAPATGEALGVSAGGATIVGWSASARVLEGEAFRWTTSGMRGLGDLPGGDNESVAFDVSEDGRFVAGASSSSRGPIEAFRWDDAHGMVGLGGEVPNHFRSVALAISADGNRIVGGLSDDSRDSGFLWEMHRGMRFIEDAMSDYGLGTAGWVLWRPEDISADGRSIIGNGVNPGGQLEAWIVELPAYCQADCDASTGERVLDIFDFLCFQDRFVGGHAYADCDGNGVFDAFDFLCFQDVFVGGCH